MSWSERLVGCERIVDLIGGRTPMTEDVRVAKEHLRFARPQNPRTGCADLCYNKAALADRSNGAISR